MTEDLDYRSMLREELVARCGRNPSYSSRAIARDLGLSPAFFSQIMSGTRILSEARAIDLAEKTAWTTKKKRIFVKLVRLQTLSSEALKRETLLEIKRAMADKRTPLSAKYHDLTHDEFKIISEWFHFAIVELADTCVLRDDSVEIAAKLGLTNMAAMQAIERLVRVGLLERADGRLKKSKANYRMSAVPSTAIREFHKEHLKKAATAIDTQSVECRDFSGTTMAINVKKLARAKVLIRRFQSRLSELLETGETSAVYHFSTQLYRLDKETP